MITCYFSEKYSCNCIFSLNSFSLVSRYWKKCIRSMAGECEKGIRPMLKSYKKRIRPMAFCTGPMPPINVARSLSGREYERITNTFLLIYHTSCVRIKDVKNSCESFLEVKYSHIFVTSVKNSQKYFTGVTNTFEFFTCVRIAWLWHSNESVIRVKNPHVFVTHE